MPERLLQLGDLRVALIQLPPQLVVLFARHGAILEFLRVFVALLVEERDAVAVVGEQLGRVLAVSGWIIAADGSRRQSKQYTAWMVSEPLMYRMFLEIPRITLH